jgi:Icc-related predicted phosphoesterase
MTKIVLISDTHTMHEQLILPKGDILVHAGDFTGRGKPWEVEEFFDWLDRQSKEFKHIVFVAGNHDMSFEYKHPWVVDILKSLPENVYYLEDSEIVIDGIKFYGSPWQPEFFNWGFNLPRGKELAEKWDMIPHDTDVLITHGPPMNILDYTARDMWNVGCLDLYNKIMQVKPKVHVFGHIHEGYGMKEQDGIVFVNASSATLKYELTNKPIVLKYIEKKVDFTQD